MNQKLLLSKTSYFHVLKLTTLNIFENLKEESHFKNELQSTILRYPYSYTYSYTYTYSYPYP